MSICNLRGDTAQFARNACTICAVSVLNLSGEAALAERNMQLTAEEYKSSWIYYLLEEFTEDETDPRYKEAKRLMFDIDIMA